MIMVRKRTYSRLEGRSILYSERASEHRSNGLHPGPHKKPPMTRATSTMYRFLHAHHTIQWCPSLWHVAQSFAVLALVPPDWDLWDDRSINGHDLKMGYWISMRRQALLSQKAQGRDLYMEADRHSLAADWVGTGKYLQISRAHAAGGRLL